MTQHHYPDADAYRAAQVEGNTRKRDRVWALEENIRWLAEHVVPRGAPWDLPWNPHRARGGVVREVHRRHVGTRHGYRPERRDRLRTVQHDFHEPRDNWLGAMDFVYSNSHDHARDPERALRTWLAQLRPCGVLILEHTDYHEQLTDYNCWAVTVTELVRMLCGMSGADAWYIDTTPSPPATRTCATASPSVVRA